jgi:tetratricopeptide (TPR) repeat protein
MSRNKVRVFLSHSSKDDGVVRELAEFLEHGGDIKTFADHHDIQPGEHFVSRIEDGLEVEAVLVVLSPDAVRSEWVDREWRAALASNIAAAPVLVKECIVPKLLAGINRFDATKNQPAAFRAIRNWLLGLPPPVVRPFHAPSRPVPFVGREDELAALRSRLAEEGAVVPVQGLAGLGKTTLAVEFAHRYKSDFEAVYWLQCVGRDLAALSGDLAVQLGLKFDGDLETVLREQLAHCGQKRCLLVLDNVDDDAPGELIPGGRASVLVTTRVEHLGFLGHGEGIKPTLFSETECFDLFRRVLGEKEVAKSEAAAKAVFGRLGYLPIAISVAAGLIKHDVRYTIDNLAKKLPPLDKLSFGKDNIGTLLADAIAATGENDRELLAAMSVCAAEGFRLALAAEVAELTEEKALDALQNLTSRSLAEELDRGARQYRLHALVRIAADPADALRARHAEAVLKRFEHWETDWRECAQDLGDMRQAFGWTLDAAADRKRWRACLRLGLRGYLLTRRIGRLPEAYEYAERLARSAEARADKSALHNWWGGQALILQDWGRFEEALALHKKQEVICEELGDRDGLQRSYGNQALILKDWGRLEEALALHKREETICEELGDRDGLQVSYGNQALILKAWGRLDESLALLTKKEAICEELGDRDGLQVSYGNQALILKAWGRLEEALALHKKEEAICEDLGNRDGLWRSYGNQAVILQQRGRLDEALALLKKHEVIATELGSREGLGYCYWNMAGLARERGESEEARTRAEAAISIFTELKMPRELDGVKELLDEIGRS